MFLRKTRNQVFVVSTDGCRPDPEKIRAIVEMPAPKDPKQLESFLGMISYYSSFVPEMHSMRGPLDDLEQGCPTHGPP